MTLATGTVRPEVTTPVVQTPLMNGTANFYSGPAEALVVRTATQFDALWTARMGGTPPAVDFSKDQVLVAFEDPTTRRRVSVARSVLLEDNELAVTVNTTLAAGAPTTRGAPYSMVTTPKTFGPVQFETVDTTPRP
ncbi:hypothetical protein OAX78_01440 [Planctomycetota bacterium]|nr:hypothetical protein [Planctomycetota bacterium]